MTYQYNQYRFSPLRSNSGLVLDYQLASHDFIISSVGDNSPNFTRFGKSQRGDSIKPETQHPRFINFLIDRTKYFHELVPVYYELFNDYVNASNIDDSGEEQAILDAINRVGNRRLNARRNILHLTEGFDEENLWYMMQELDANDKVQSKYAMPSFIPLFPPYELINALQSSEKSHEYYTSRINLEASDTGYKRYVKSNHPDLPSKTASERWAFETREASGFKSVIISPFEEDGSTVNPFFVLGSVQDGKDMSTLDSDGSTSAWAGDGAVTPTKEHQNLRVPDIETVMDKAYTQLGDAMGSFLPDANSHQWINFPARLKIQYYKDRSGTISAFERTLYKVANPASPDYNTPIVDGAYWWQEKMLRDGSLWTHNGVTETEGQEILLERKLVKDDYGLRWRVGDPADDTKAFQMRLHQKAAAGEGIFEVGLADLAGAKALNVVIDEKNKTITTNAGTTSITTTLDGTVVVGVNGTKFTIGDGSIILNDGMSTIEMNGSNVTITGDVIVSGTLDVQ